MIDSRLMRLAPLALALPVGAAQADTLLASRFIDESTETPRSMLTANLRWEEPMGGPPDLLFSIPLTGVAPNTVFTFASNADSPNYDTIVGLLTDGASQSIRFAATQDVSTPIGFLETEQDFFSLATTDLQGETIERIEFELFSYTETEIEPPPSGVTPVGGEPLEPDPFFLIELQAEVRVYGADPTGNVIPTPTAAALGLAGLALLARRRRAIA